MSSGSQNFRSTGHLSVSGLLYPDLLSTAITELTPQVSNAFNAASNGGMVLTSSIHPGDYAASAQFINHGGLISRRQVGSASPGNQPITPTRLNRSEIISVKLNESLYVEDSFDALAKTFGTVPADVTALLAEEIAKDRAIYKLDRALTALVAATMNQASLNIDIGGAVSPQRTITSNDLVDTLAQFGDQASQVACWVMHSKVWFDLVKSQITANIDGLSSFNVQTGRPETLGIPVIVSDSAALVNTSSPGELSEYVTLGLKPGAVTITESEAFDIDFQTVHGNDNVQFSIQNTTGAFDVGLMGYSYDLANGGINPTDTVLGTGTNWDRVLQLKNTGAVAIQSL
ncbi:MAG: major capsid protein [Pseudomonadaceae bacterium]|nr:major capsid protein [Pseudomonadaceae bacterium]